LGWVGLHAPVGTPKEVVSTLEAAASKALQNPEVRDRLTGQGADAAALSADAYGKFVMDEAARWKGIVEAAGIPTQ
jgi:tripartite-type tricarboxylate transporter receptor subunit TctC